MWHALNENAKDGMQFSIRHVWKKRTRYITKSIITISIQANDLHIIYSCDTKNISFIMYKSYMWRQSFHHNLFLFPVGIKGPRPRENSRRVSFLFEEPRDFWKVEDESLSALGNVRSEKEAEKGREMERWDYCLLLEPRKRERRRARHKT